MDKILTEYKNRMIQQIYSRNTLYIYCKYFRDFYCHFKEECLEIENINNGFYTLNSAV